MKKFLIIIFTILTILTPLFSIKAETELGSMKITGFSPTEGKEGDKVIITGENFSSVNKILFGSVTSTIDAITGTTITTKVPANAISGKIIVETKKGIDTNQLTSANDFKVIPKFDLTVYNEKLSIAKDLYYNSEEGTSIGNYPIGSREVFKAAIDTVSDISKINNQEGIDGYIVILDNAVVDFRMKKITDETIVGKEQQQEEEKEITKEKDTKSYDLSNKSGGLIPECTGKDGCSFNELMQLVNNVIKFLLFTIATPLAALGIVYAGWLYLSAGGSTENTTKAKKILTNIIIGYVIALVAWLVVNTILKSLGLDPSINTFLK